MTCPSPFSGSGPSSMSLGEDLVFIFCPPRSGSTMLQLMLDSHSAITSLPEPFALPPLRYLGYYGAFSGSTVYDSINQSRGFQEFVDALPGGEETFLLACRRYAATLYDAARQSAQKDARYFLDKTPANVLTWDIITRIFPRARYIVLTRHPLALIDSQARSFFLGNYQKMAAENPRFLDALPAIAAFLRESPVPKHVIRYEDLVSEPEKMSRSMLEFLDLSFEENVIHYGRTTHARGSLGDPMTASREERPRESYAWQWASNLKDKPAHLDTAMKLLATINDSDLEAYGYARRDLKLPVKNHSAAPSSVKPPVSRSGNPLYHFRRGVFFALKGLLRRGPLRGMVKSIRYYCDVLLR